VRLVDALLYFPSRTIVRTPRSPYEDLAITTEDGEQLHTWRAPARARRGEVLLCHGNAGNAGNVGDRAAHIDLLTASGFDVLAFDYRGYGASTGRPSEAGLLRDARAAGARLGGDRVLYLGESLGGAVALALALEQPPAGLVLLSAFTSLRDMARLHYKVPAALVPDAYPSRDRVAHLRAPLLVLHGARDDIVPLGHAHALVDAAPEPKALHVFPHAGHNDVIGREWAAVIAAWAGDPADGAPRPACLG